MGRLRHYSSIHLSSKSVSVLSVSEFPMILSSDDASRTWALCLCIFSIGILTEIFMNSEPSGILYCLIWVHELRTCRNARGRSTEWLTRSLEITVTFPQDLCGKNEVRYGLWVELVADLWPDESIHRLMVQMNTYWPSVIFRRVHGPGVIFGYSPTPGVIFSQKATLCDNF